MKVAWWAIAAALLGAAAVVLAFLAGPGPAIVLGGTAVAVVLLSFGRTADHADHRSTGTADGVLALLESMELRGVPLHLAPSPEGVVRWFVPAADLGLEDAPEWDGATVVDRSGTSRFGAYLPAPEQGLEDALRERTGLPEGRGRDEAVPFLQQGFRDLGIGREVRAFRTPEGLQVTWTPSLITDAMTDAIDQQDMVAIQCHVPGASLACLLLARATGGPVRLAGAERNDGHITLDVATWT